MTTKSPADSLRFHFDSIVYSGYDLPQDGIGNHLRLLDQLIFGDGGIRSRSLEETIVHDSRDAAYGNAPAFDHLRRPDAYRNCLYFDIARNMADARQLEKQRRRAIEFKRIYSAVTGIYLFWESDRIPNEVLALLKAYDFCIVTAAFLKDELDNFGLDVVLLPHPYDFARPHPADIPLHSDPRPLRFGSSAGLWQRKNTSLLVETFAEVFGNNPDYALSIHTRSDINHVDYAPELRKIRPLMERNSNITLLPASLARPAYLAWLNTLDVYCFISSGEGYSVTPREALHLGKPVLISDAHVHRDLAGLPGVVPVRADAMKPARPNVATSSIDVGYDWAVDRESLAFALNHAAARFRTLRNELATRYAEILDRHDLDKARRAWAAALNSRYDLYRRNGGGQPFASDIFLEDWLERFAPRTYRIGQPGVSSNTGERIENRLQCFASKHEPGHCMYGPDHFVTDDGRYEVEFHVRFLNIFDCSRTLVTLDVYDQRSQRIIALSDIRLDALPHDARRFLLPFSGEKGQRLEFRVYWHGTCDLEVSMVVLRRLEPGAPANESRFDTTPETGRSRRLQLTHLEYALQAASITGVEDDECIFHNTEFTIQCQGAADLPEPLTSACCLHWSVRRQALRELLHQWHAFTQNLGIRYVVLFGTLLGAVRDGRIIPYDCDLDVGIDDRDLAVLASSTKMSGPRQTASRGENPTQLDVYESDRWLLRLRKDWEVRANNVIDATFVDKLHGLYIDIYTWDEDAAGGRLTINGGDRYEGRDGTILGRTSGGTVLPFDEFLPLKQWRLEDLDVLVPNREDLVLTYDYGSGFRTPNRVLVGNTWRTRSPPEKWITPMNREAILGKR